MAKTAHSKLQVCLILTLIPTPWIQICYPCLTYHPLSLPFSNIPELVLWKLMLACFSYFTENIGGHITLPTCEEPCLNVLAPSEPSLSLASWMYVCWMSEWFTPHFTDSSPQPTTPVFLLYPLHRWGNWALHRIRDLPKPPIPTTSVKPQPCALWAAPHYLLTQHRTYWKPWFLDWNINKQHIKIMSKVLYFS